MRDIKTDTELQTKKRSHQPTCVTDRSNYCDLCDKAYTNIKRHRVVHSGERPFECSLCRPKRRYADVASLFRHERTHTGDRPYACAVCDKRFTRSDLLKKHEERHSSWESRRLGTSGRCETHVPVDASFNTVSIPNRSPVGVVIEEDAGADDNHIDRAAVVEDSKSDNIRAADYSNKEFLKEDVKQLRSTLDETLEITCSDNSIVGTKPPVKYDA